jgi:translation initiation factor IF-3
MLINEQIADENLFVIDETGKNIGILNKNKALELAKKKKLDLVLFTQAKKLNEKSIAKIIDYKKFLYQQQIKEKLIRKKNNINNKIKELKIKPVIDSHDVE